MTFDEYVKINKKVWVRDNPVCKKVLENIKKDIKIKLIDTKACAHVCEKRIYLQFNANNDTVWHEIGHLMFDSFDIDTQKEFYKALYKDLKNLGAEYQYKQGVLSDAYRIIKRKLAPGYPDLEKYDSYNRKTRRAIDKWLAEKRGYLGGHHDEDYGEQYQAFFAATETYAELFSCLFCGVKGNQRLPLFSKLFKESIGKLIQDHT